MPSLSVTKALNRALAIGKPRKYLWSSSRSNGGETVTGSPGIEKKFSIRVVAKDYRIEILCSGVYQPITNSWPLLRRIFRHTPERRPRSSTLSRSLATRPSSPCACTAAITTDIHPAVQRRVLARRREIASTSQTFIGRMDGLNGQTPNCHWPSA
jgi:hypothetical protein